MKKPWLCFSFLTNNLVILPNFFTHWDLHACRGEAGEVGSKKDLIQTARLIAKESEEVVKMAKKVADACTDKRMKRVSASF